VPAVNDTDPVHTEIVAEPAVPLTVKEVPEAVPLGVPLGVAETYPPLPPGKVIVNWAP